MQVTQVFFVALGTKLNSGQLPNSGLDYLFITNSIKQSPPRFLYQVQNVFKALVSAKIRIGYFCYTFRKLFAILHEQPELMAVLRRAFPLKYGEISPIHRQNIMKNFEIPLMYLPRT